MADPLTPEQKERAAELLQKHAGKTDEPEKTPRKFSHKEILVMSCLLSALAGSFATHTYHKANPTLVERTNVIYEDKDDSMYETIKRITNYNID